MGPSIKFVTLVNYRDNRAVHKVYHTTERERGDDWVAHKVCHTTEGGETMEPSIKNIKLQREGRR